MTHDAFLSSPCTADGASLEAQLACATADVHATETALSDAATFVRALGAQGEFGRVADDPHVILRFGQLRARLHAAEGLLARASQLLKNPVDNDVLAAVALSEVVAFTRDLLLDTTVLRAALGEHAALHPGRGAAAHHWDYFRAGNYFLNGVRPGKQFSA